LSLCDCDARGRKLPVGLIRDRSQRPQTPDYFSSSKRSSGEIFALGADGNRVPALPPQEAANQAGGSAGLASSVEIAAAYAAPSAAGGAATAAVGSALSGGSMLSGSLIGSAIGLVMGAGTGLYQAHVDPSLLYLP
jgi:hypothetical protein